MTLPLRAFPFAGSGGGSNTFTELVHFRHEENAGVDGGGLASGARRTRTINVEKSDVGGHGSLATNQMTLAAGTYRFLILLHNTKTNASKSVLVNVDDTVDIEPGSSGFSPSSDSGHGTSWIMGRFTIAAQKKFEVQQLVSLSNNTNGEGAALNLGGLKEVYLDALFWKEIT